MLNETISVQERFSSAPMQSEYSPTYSGDFPHSSLLSRHVLDHMSMMCLLSAQVKKALLRTLEAPFLKTVYTSLQQWLLHWHLPGLLGQCLHTRLPEQSPRKKSTLLRPVFKGGGVKLNKIYKVGSSKTCRTAIHCLLCLFEYLEVLHHEYTCCYCLVCITEFCHICC